MSGKVIYRCKYCGEYVHPCHRLHRKQTAHTSCIIQRPPDLVVDIGNFHMAIHTELYPPSRLSKIIRKLPMPKQEE